MQLYSSSARLSGATSAHRMAIYAVAALMLAFFADGAFAQSSSLKISGTPATTGKVGSSYTFQPSTSGSRSYRLRFTVTNKPSWASLSQYSGRLTGVPTTAGTYSNIVITASDGRSTARLPAFSIQVASSGGTTPPPTQTNRAPTISGSPLLQVMQAVAYSFQPVASDPDGNLLTFAITNKPAWVTFNPFTGSLTGTPTAAQVGTYSNIGISVSDGKGGSASLATFSIAVIQSGSATGSATVSWSSPTTNTNGSALTNLAGYRVLYGTTRGGPYSNAITVSNPSVTRQVVESLVPGTYYFVVTARNSSGAESAYSAEASKTIR